MFSTFFQPTSVKMAFTFSQRRKRFMITSSRAPHLMHRCEMEAHMAHTRALCERTSELLSTFEAVLFDEARTVPLMVLWPMYSVVYAFHGALFGRLLDLDRRLGVTIDRVECTRVRYCHRLRYYLLSKILGMYVPEYNFGL